MSLVIEDSDQINLLMISDIFLLTRRDSNSQPPVYETGTLTN